MGEWLPVQKLMTGVNKGEHGTEANLDKYTGA